MSKSRWRRFFVFLAIGLFSGAALLFVFLTLLSSEIQSRLASGWFLPPIEIYASPERVWVGRSMNVSALRSRLLRDGFRERSADLNLLPGDFVELPAEGCTANAAYDLPDETATCLALKTPEREFGPDRTSRTLLMVFDASGRVLALGTDAGLTTEVRLWPSLFAQYFGEEPMLRQLVQLGQVPLACSQAVTAVEDRDFLTHQGVSWAGLGRAFVRNLQAGRLAQGGSTITQQLVKNYFLTPEKTLRRKAKEFLMALILEQKFPKDQILESYLNVIYMGQNGSFQIRGFAAAALHYFDRRLEDLDLPECALLAAMINSPGRYAPFRQPERARERRTKVLQDMVASQMISAEDAKAAAAAPLPRKRKQVLSDPAPYFVQAVRRRLNEIGIDGRAGLRVYTTMNEAAQELAQQTVPRELAGLEQRFPLLKKQVEQKKRLDGLLISIDLQTGGILALVGGREYRKTQFNRSLDARRQVGSVMKPLVYLTALESEQPDGKGRYTPLTLVADEPFTHRYDGQSWSPQNYEREHAGPVPLFYALKNSLNVATARLGLDVGLSRIIEVARRAGVVSPLEPLPSLTLGAFELTPLEVAQVYTTIGRQGITIPVHVIGRVEDLAGQVLYDQPAESEQVFEPQTTAVLTGMLRQTLESGTGRPARAWGFGGPAAGKTGTTSDTKDAWFVGYTPHVLTVVWVGYDDNTPSGLTGASGAIPIWAQFMNQVQSQYPEDEFPFVPGTMVYELSGTDMKELIPAAKEAETSQDVRLILRDAGAQ